MPSWGILAGTGVIWSACYMLWMYQRVFYGSVKNPVNNSLSDLDLRERGAIWPLAILALVMGVASSYWIKPMDPSVAAILNTATPAKSSATQVTYQSIDLSSRAAQIPATSHLSSRAERSGVEGPRF